jgi:SAM-dependent methyltransferase
MTEAGFKCLNCAGSAWRLVFGGVPDRFHGFPGAFDYVACTLCGLVQLKEIPSNLGDFYEGYRVHEGDSVLYRLLRRLTIGHCYLEERGHGRKLLDIGCGNGFYIERMASLGWRPVGYEFEPAYAKALSDRIGLPIITGELALEQRPEQFDLVTFNLSFEHLDQPVRFLELATKCLRPGGEIYISVPNIESREAAIFRDRWFHLDPPRHVSFFTKALLREQLTRLGLIRIVTKNLPAPTGFAGSLSYRLWNRFAPLTWYAGVVPGMIFSVLVSDGQFAISARRPPPASESAPS